MTDFDNALERLLREPQFAAQLAADPDRALAGYRLSTEERAVLLADVSLDAGMAVAVEQRTSKAGMVGLFSVVAEAFAAGGSGLPVAGPASPNAGLLSRLDLPDSDGDGLKDVTERTIGTDPSDVDSDNDGILDGAEAKFGTNPLAADTDSDGYDDYAEIAAGTDPTDPSVHPDGPVPTQSLTDPYGDQDHDGLTDAEEWAYGTNPADADTDGDGFTDGAELLHGTDPNHPDEVILNLAGLTNTGPRWVRRRWRAVPRLGRRRRTGRARPHAGNRWLSVRRHRW